MKVSLLQLGWEGGGAAESLSLFLVNLPRQTGDGMSLCGEGGSI